MKVSKPAVTFFFLYLITQLTFLTLKGLNILKWDWGWILAPTWLPYAAILLLSVCLFVYLFGSNIIERIQKYGRLSDR